MAQTLEFRWHTDQTITVDVVSAAGVPLESALPALELASGKGRYRVSYPGEETGHVTLHIIIATTYLTPVFDYILTGTTNVHYPVADIDRTVFETVSIPLVTTSVGVVTIDDLTWTYYGTQSRASIYFDKRLNTRVWDETLSSDREAALIMATRAIDKLNFAGDKSDADQALQFPRGDDVEIPVNIEYAAYEIVLALLDGYEPDQEVETLGVLSETYSGVRTTYDADHVNEHIRAGIPSIEAWDLLRPYLRDPTQVRLSRVS